MEPQPTPSNLDDIRDTLGLFLSPGGVIEIRVPNVDGRKRTDAGYFDDLEAAVTAAAAYSGTAPAVYVTLNPCNPALLARAKNRMEEYAKTATADPDIVRRLWLLIDCDPIRPSDISSTDSEQLASIALAYQVQDFLTALGFPKGIIGSSGNGGHLLHRVDLPNDAESLALVKRCLEALAARFNTEAVKVDTGVGNAARITKLYGTLVCKGDNTPERPHRVSRLFSTEPPAVVSREQLEALAALGAGAPARPTRVPLNSGNFIDGFIERHRAALDLREPKDWQGGRLWVFNTCPFDASHEQNGATQLIEMASGVIVASCHHERCKGKGWADLRQMFEPTAVRQLPRPADAPSKELVRWRAGSELDSTPISYLVADMIPNGMLGALGGKDGRGKTLLGLEIARCVLKGERLFERFTVKRGKVFAMLLDDPEFLVHERLEKMGILDHPDLKIATRNDVDMNNPPVMLAFLADQLAGLDPAFILIDALYLFVPDGGGADQANSSSAMGPVMSALDEIANRTGATVAVVAHDNKAGSDIGGTRVIRQMFKWIVRLILPREFEDDPEGGVETPERVLQLNKLKTGKPASWHLQLGGPGAWVYQGTGKEYRAAALQDQAIEYLTEGGAKTAHEVARALKKRPAAVIEACKSLVQTGRAREQYRPATRAGGQAVVYQAGA
jgi:nicotinamidase-related amidase